jgi:thiol-disulfide isomerase/thioredoxin
VSRLTPTSTARLPAAAPLLALVVAIAGCGGAGSVTPVAPSPTHAVAAPSTVAPVEPVATPPGPASSDVPTPGASSPPTPGPAAAALAGRAWATARLTDVATGDRFTIADFAGRTVFVETMAIWCSKCRAQQARFTEALARVDPASVAYVVLTVEPAETSEDLARYRAERGFTGRYAVAGRDVSAALADEFGANVLNPPSVPVIVVSPAGEVTFGTGGESVDDIVALAGA